MAEIVGGPKPVRAKDVARRLLRHENTALILILIAITAVMAVISGGLNVTRKNVANVLLQSSTRGIAAIGQFFVILTAGIDLSVGGIALISIIMAASLMTSHPEQSVFGYPVAMIIAIPATMLLGIAIGAINGVSVSRLGMPPLIVTLAMWQITRGIAYQFGHGFTIFHLPEVLSFWGQGNVGGVAVPTLTFIVVVVVAYFTLYYTTFGRSVYAVGGNPVSAWLSGINVKRVLFSVYTISGFLAALSSLSILGRTMCASMSSIAGLEIESIAAVVIGGVSLAGGRGTLIGVLIGAIIIGVINNGMNMIGFDPSFQELVRGGIIFSAVAIDIYRRR